MSRMRRWAVFATLGVSACGGSGDESGGQAGSASEGPLLLDQPVQSHGEAFGFLQGVRELPDSRVLVADPLGQVFGALDMITGATEAYGGVGQGPQEYRQPDNVWAMAGGRSLLVDLGNGRLTVIEADGAFGQTYPIATGSPGPGAGFQIRVPGGVDLTGNVYFTANGGVEEREARRTTLLRWNTSSDQTDTVATLLASEVKVSESGGAGSRNVSMRQVPLSTRDGWAVGGDGRLAIARAEPYRVDWIEPDGTVREGPVTDFEAIPIRQADKEEWADVTARGGLSIQIGVSNGAVQTSMSRGGQAAADRDLTQYDWPDSKPAFDPGGVVVSPDGEAWVLRHTQAGEDTLYDIFDGSGERIRQVRLRAGRRVIAFGEGSVYVVFTDDVDLQYLEKYTLP